MPERTSPETLRDHIHARLLTESSGRAWSNVSVQLLSHQPVESNLLVPAVAEPLLVWIVSGSARIEERDLGGAWIASDVSAGAFYLTNTSTPYEMRWTTAGPEPFVVLHLYLGLALYGPAINDVLGDAADSDFQLQDISGQRDKTLSGLLQMIHAELTGPAEPSEMYVQGIAQALAIHLVRHYPAQETSASRKGALPTFKLQRVVRSMEARLDREFSLAASALEAGLSPFHFSRAFKQSTGYAPSEYFIRLRIAAARRLLRETDKSVIEIGLDIGYSSPSHFAQMFKRAVGVTPSEYRS